MDFCNLETDPAPQICGTILWRLNNKSAKVRQQAADLISRIAVVMKTCQEEKLMGHLGVSTATIAHLPLPITNMTQN